MTILRVLRIQCVSRSESSSHCETPDSTALYRAVQDHFVRSRTTFNKWCKDNGISRTYAEKALKGERNGPIAKNIWKYS